MSWLGRKEASQASQQAQEAQEWFRAPCDPPGEPFSGGLCRGLGTASALLVEIQRPPEGVILNLRMEYNKWHVLELVSYTQSANCV
jgi:hypothetical protein